MFVPFYNPELSTIMGPFSEAGDVPDLPEVPGEWKLLDYISNRFECGPVLVLGSDGTRQGMISTETMNTALAQALAEAAAFYAGVLDTVDDSLTIIDSEGKVIGWNRQAQDMYSIPLADIIDKPITHHFPKDAVMLLKSIYDGSAVSRHYNQPRPGSHVLVNTSPVRIEGRIIGAISAEKDITDVVRLNERLSTTEAHLHDLEKELFADEQHDHPFFKIKGTSPALMEAIRTVRKAAHTDVTMLLTGESGVGKELFSEAIHYASLRADHPFIALNCGAIPAALFESELFGYKKGAFTGAVNEGKKGKIDAAEGGTLFLDEIGELPLDQQVKLLRVLQERQFYRVGGHEPIKTDVRFLAATNRDLEAMVSAGQFREDLFYRLNVVSVRIPSLRERREDIPSLARIFLEEFAAKYHRPLPELDPRTTSLLLEYHWPGNIRQLRNIMERLVILADEKYILPEHLADSLPHVSTAPTSVLTAEPPVQKSEYEEIVETLRLTYGNKSAAAHILGISRATLYNRMKKYGLE